MARRTLDPNSSLGAALLGTAGLRSGIATMNFDSILERYLAEGKRSGVLSSEFAAYIAKLAEDEKKPKGSGDEGAKD